MNNPNEKKFKLYKIINPSDLYTFKAPDFKSACVAMCILGSGNYGIKEIDNNKGDSMPPFVLVDVDEWFKQTFGKDFRETYPEVSKSVLADIMESVLIGNAEDRKIFGNAILIIPEDERKKWKEVYHDRRRSSMNDIGRRAQTWAKSLREQAKYE